MADKTSTLFYNSIKGSKKRLHRLSTKQDIAKGQSKTVSTFAIPRATLLFLFDTLVTPTLFHGLETWEPNLNKENNKKKLEKPLVLMLAHMI